MIELDQTIYTVKDITNLIKGNLESAFPLVWVEGEISNFRVPSSGHMYFVLKDETSQLRVVMFRGNNRYIKFTPRDGQKILVRGNITVYAVRGEYQLIANLMEPRGIGELQLQFLELKEKLANEGLFDSSKKKQLPRFPATIGIITSPTGAAVQDMIRILFRRFPGLLILVYPVKVQGEGAAEEIAHAIEQVNKDGRADVIIVGRGGGSIEDLWAFNEEIVARSIFLSKIPVVSAVGHEIDFTIADFVADLRAPTPSAAAELVVPDKTELQNSIQHMLSRCYTAIQQKIRNMSYDVELLVKGRSILIPQQKIREYQQLMDDLYMSCLQEPVRMVENLKQLREHLSKNLFMVSPRNNMNQKNQLFLNINEKLLKNMTLKHQVAQTMLQQLQATLNSLSPLNVLDRGYCIVRKLPGKILVKKINQLAKRDLVEILLYDGSALCQIKDIFPEDKIK